MKKKTSKVLALAGLFISLGVLTSCNSFCEDQDKSAYMFGYDSLNVKLFDSREDALTYANLVIPEGYEGVTLDTKILDKNGNEISLISEEKFGEYNVYYIHTASLSLKNKTDATDIQTVVFGKNEFIQSLETTCTSSNINIPYYQFYEEFDLNVLDNIFDIAKKSDKNYKSLNKSDLGFKEIYGYDFNDYIEYQKNPSEELLDKMLSGNGTTIGRDNCLLTKYGYSKFPSADESYFSFIKTANDNVIKNNFAGFGMNSDFLYQYETTLTSKISSVKTCISVVDDGVYGHISNDPLNETVPITNKASKGFFKSWGEAFEKNGFLEGLLVYPIAYSVETLSHKFGMNGWGQIGAVLLVTVIIRLLLAAIMLPQTMQQQKMNIIQPEITKLQQKYPNANTNQYEKQRLSQAQLALYKKYGVKPFLSILLMIVQFPVFICVWNAMTGCASLSSDSVLGLYLSDTIWNTLKNFTGWPHNTGWWTALVLILLMSGSQIVAMLLPQWFNKKRMKSIPKYGVSQSQKQQDQQGKMFSYIMTGMVILMGFTLPSAMGVYWFAGAIFSIIQTLITQVVIKKKGM